VASVILSDLAPSRGERRGDVTDHHVDKATRVAEEARHDDSEEGLGVHVHLAMLERDSKALEGHDELIRILTNDLPEERSQRSARREGGNKGEGDGRGADLGIYFVHRVQDELDEGSWTRGMSFVPTEGLHLFIEEPVAPQPLRHGWPIDLTLVAVRVECGEGEQTEAPSMLCRGEDDVVELRANSLQRILC
jgi:hypothetical protein